jgi:hypothetical protein
MFGGEAEGDQFEVDGYRFAAPQGSNATLVPAAGLLKHYWDALKIPIDFQFAAPENTSNPIRVARDHYGPAVFCGADFRRQLVSQRTDQRPVAVPS